MKDKKLKLEISHWETSFSIQLKYILTEIEYGSCCGKKKNYQNRVDIGSSVQKLH